MRAGVKASVSVRRVHPLLTHFLLVGFVAAGCGQEAPPPLEGEGEGGAAWISGTVDERFQQVGEQFAGFSSAMFEVAHRYTELHWAVEDGNWRYADYQVDKIAGAIERGIERRPGRAESARTHFLGDPVARMRAVLEGGDRAAIEQELRELTGACNQCHVAEGMEFVQVVPPPERASVVRGRD